MSINFQVNGSVFKEGEGSFFIEVKGAVLFYKKRMVYSFGEWL